MPPTLLGRRTLLGATLLALSGCGFELRRAPELRFRTIALSGFKSRSPLADELRTSINASTTTQVVDSPAQAQVVLQALEEVNDKSVVASTAAAQVRDYQLRARFNFSLHNTAGKELIPPTEILQTRDLSYSESVALAKEQEEAFLFRAMQRDIAAQVVRRLVALQGV